MRVFLAGPIEHWWGENWETPEHWHYADWRHAVNEALVARGHLVYRPFEAFKGEWDANEGDLFAQTVNDAALLACEVILNLTPPGVPSDGTDKEILVCTSNSKLVINAPPPLRHDHWNTALSLLCCEIEEL